MCSKWEVETPSELTVVCFFGGDGWNMRVFEPMNCVNKKVESFIPRRVSEWKRSENWRFLFGDH